MPVRRDKDKDGPYFQWGYSGKKYYYKLNNEQSRKVAKAKAAKQGKAIKASQARAARSYRGGGSIIDYHQLYQKYEQLYKELTKGANVG